MVQEKNPAGLIKNIFILGPEIESDPEIKALYEAREDWLMVGDGAADKPLMLQDIKDKIGNSSFAEMPVFYICAHGTRKAKKHRIQIDTPNPERGCDTGKFLKKIRDLVGGPVCVKVYSCYGGSANKEAKALGNGSILITNIEGKEPAYCFLDNLILYSSLKRSWDTNLNPYQQFILDLQGNFTATTFTKVESDSKTTQFKSIRVPKKAEMFNIVSEMKEHEHLKNFVNKFLGQEGARFQKTFQEEDVTKEIKTISELNDQSANRLVTGILCHLCSVKRNINIPLFEKFVNQLLSSGIDINAGLSNTIRPLIAAVAFKKTAIAEVLIKMGKNLDLIEEKSSGTALHMALSVMFKKGGRTAIRRGTVITKMLLDNGADPDKKGKDGITPLHLAIILASERGLRRVGNAIGKEMLINGAKANVQDKNGYSALHMAVLDENTTMIQILLENGADLNIKDKDGYTPIDLAREQKNVDLTKMLVNEQLARPVRSQLIDYFCHEIKNKQRIDPTYFNKITEDVTTILLPLYNDPMNNDIKKAAKMIAKEAFKDGKKLDSRQQITINIAKFLNFIFNKKNPEFKDILKNKEAKIAFEQLRNSGVSHVTANLPSSSSTATSNKKKAGLTTGKTL